MTKLAREVVETEASSKALSAVWWSVLIEGIKQGEKLFHRIASRLSVSRGERI